MVTVSEFRALTGISPTPYELARLRECLGRSSAIEALADTMYSIIDARRVDLAASIGSLADLGRLASMLGAAELASLPHADIAATLSSFTDATGLMLVRVACGEAARLCIEDPLSLRMFDIGDDLDAWLHGRTADPGPVAAWIGPPVEDFTRDELIAAAAHDYQLPANSARRPR